MHRKKINISTVLAGQKLDSKRSITAFGSSPSCTTISATSTWSRKPCNPSTTRSAPGCHHVLGTDRHPCLRAGQKGRLERAKGFEPSTPTLAGLCSAPLSPECNEESCPRLAPEGQGWCRRPDLNRGPTNWYGDSQCVSSSRPVGNSALPGSTGDHGSLPTANRRKAHRPSRAAVPHRVPGPGRASAAGGRDHHCVPKRQLRRTYKAARDLSRNSGNARRGPVGGFILVPRHGPVIHIHGRRPRPG